MAITSLASILPSSSLSSKFSLVLGITTGLALAQAYRWIRTKRHTAPRRFGGAIRLPRHFYTRYRMLHDRVWPQVLERMSHSNIRNFVIYYHEETETLFQHFEWIGNWKTRSLEEEEELFQSDMNAIANDPMVREWWRECEPCQVPFSQWLESDKLLSEGGTGDWWSPLECVTHCGHWPVGYTHKLRDPDFVTLKEK